MVGKSQESPLRSALAEGAARLEQLMKPAGAQASEAPVSAIAGSQAFFLSPEEVWARKFMNQGIGPRPEFTPVGGIVQPPVLAAPPTREMFAYGQDTATTATSYADEPMGAVAQRSGNSEQQSWLSRWVFGSRAASQY